MLQASLRPAKPPNFDLVPGPYGVDIRTRRISTAIYPLNLTIQVSLRANYTAGNPQWVNQTFVLGDSYNSSPSFSETLAFDAANLTVLTPYVTRCRATSRVGSGPWSDVQVRGRNVKSSSCVHVHGNSVSRLLASARSYTRATRDAYTVCPRLLACPEQTLPPKRHSTPLARSSLTRSAALPPTHGEHLGTRCARSRSRCRGKALCTRGSRGTTMGAVGPVRTSAVMLQKSRAFFCDRVHA